MIKPIDYLDLLSCLLSKPENIGKDHLAAASYRELRNFVLLIDPSAIKTLYPNSFYDLKFFLKKYRNSLSSLEKIAFEKHENPISSPCGNLPVRNIQEISVNISEVNTKQLNEVLNTVRKATQLKSLKLQWKFFQGIFNFVSPGMILRKMGKYLRHLENLEIEWLDFLNEHEDKMLQIGDLFTIPGIQHIKTFKCSSLYVDEKQLMKLVSYKRAPVFSFQAETLDLSFSACELSRTIRIDFPLFPKVKSLKLDLSDVQNPTKLFKSLFFMSKPLRLEYLYLIDSESADIDLKYVFDMLDPNTLLEFQFKSSNIRYDESLFVQMYPDLPLRFPNLKEICFNGVSFFYLLFQKSGIPLNINGPRSFEARIKTSKMKEDTSTPPIRYLYMKNLEAQTGLPVNIPTDELESLSVSKIKLSQIDLKQFFAGPKRALNITRLEIKKTLLDNAALKVIVSSELMNQITVLKLESLSLPRDYIQVFKRYEHHFKNLQELSLRENRINGQDFRLLFSIEMPALRIANLIDTEDKPPKHFLEYLKESNGMRGLEELFISIDLKMDTFTLDQLRALSYLQNLKNIYITNRYYEITREMMKHKKLRKVSASNFASGYRYEELITTLQESLDSFVTDEFLF